MTESGCLIRNQLFWPAVGAFNAGFNTVANFYSRCMCIHNDLETLSQVALPTGEFLPNFRLMTDVPTTTEFGSSAYITPPPITANTYQNHHRFRYHHHHRHRHFIVIVLTLRWSSSPTLCHS